MQGFIKLHRKLLQWGWYTDNVVKGTFLHLLLMANYEPSEWKGITIEAGQVITGRKRLAEDLGFTEQQIRSALDKLKATQEITIKTTNKFSIITIVNWAEYQFQGFSDNQDFNQDFNQQITNKQPTNNQQITTSKNIRNKEYKNIILFYSRTRAYERFLDLWENVMNDILGRYSEVAFNVWFKSFYLIDEQDNVYIFAVPSELIKQTIEKNYLKEIEEILKKHTNQDARLEVIVNEIS